MNRFLILSCFALAFSLQAQSGDLVAPMTVGLTATYSTAGSAVGGAADSQVLEKYTEHQQHLNGKTILSWVGNEAGLDLAGYALAFDVTSNKIVAIDHATGNAQDLSAYLVLVQPTNWVQAGTDNETSGKYSINSTGAISISFSDSIGNSFVLTGLAKTVQTGSATTTPTGKIKLTYSVTFNCVGQGTLGGNNAVYSGNISGAGAKTTITAE